MVDISVDDQRANFNTGPYGDPLKNQNVENQALSCFKLAQIRQIRKEHKSR